MNSLDISDLCFSYGVDSEKHLVFQNNDLTVDDCRIIGLVGVNGSGKSTLLKLIKGDLKAEKGSIKVCQRPVNELSNVSFITQQAIDNIFPKLTVFENYMLFHGKNNSSFQNYDRKENRQSCLKLILSAGMSLEDKIDEQVRFLSGGQQQALGIMLACDTDSPILLMDEPTASLDIFVAEKVLKIAIQEILKKEGLLIFTSHNLHDISKYTEHIIVMRKGGKMVDLPNMNKDMSVSKLREMMLS